MSTLISNLTTTLVICFLKESYCRLTKVLNLIAWVRSEDKGVAGSNAGGGELSRVDVVVGGNGLQWTVGEASSIMSMHACRTDVNMNWVVLKTIRGMGLFWRIGFYLPKEADCVMGRGRLADRSDRRQSAVGGRLLPKPDSGNY